MGFWICWYFLSLWVPNYTFQYRIHYHDATTSPPNPLTPKSSLRVVTPSKVSTLLVGRNQDSDMYLMNADWDMCGCTL